MTTGAASGLPETTTGIAENVHPSWRDAWTAAAPDQRGRIITDRLKANLSAIVDAFVSATPPYPIASSALPRGIEIEVVKDEDGIVVDGTFRTLKTATVADLVKACAIEQDEFVEHIRTLYPIACLLLERMLDGAEPGDPARREA